MRWCNVGHKAAAELIQDAGAAKVALIASADSVIPSSEFLPPSSLFFGFLKKSPEAQRIIN
jgi:hypothetical protein